MRDVAAGLVRQIWPTRLRRDRLNPPNTFARYSDAIKGMSAIPAGEEERAIVLESTRKMVEAEETRRDGIDTRAGLLLAAAGISISLTVSFLTEPVLRDSLFLLRVSYVVAVLFLVRSTTTALRVLGTRVWHKLGPDELVEQYRNPSALATGLSMMLLNQLLHNYQVNNERADALYVAQRCFRNAVLSLMAVSAVLVLA